MNLPATSNATPSTNTALIEFSPLSMAAWIVHNLPEAAAVVDVSLPGIPVVQINQAFAALTFSSTAVAVKVANAVSSLPDLLGLDTLNADWMTLTERLANGKSARLQCRAYRQQREAFWADISCRPLSIPPDLETLEMLSTLAIVVVRDDSAAWLSTQAMRHQTRRFDALLSDIDEAVLQADSALVLSALNPAAEALTGWTATAAAGRPLGDVVHLVNQRTGAALGNPLLSALLMGDGTQGTTTDAILERDDSSRVPVTFRTAVVRDDEGKAIEGLLLMRNNSDASILANAVVHTAGHDALTDLPNRNIFEDRLSQAFALAARHERMCAMLIIDVTDISKTTQVFGQNTSDTILKAVALRLRAVFRRSDTVCRIDDARFAVVLPQVDNQATPDVLAAKAVSGASQPVQIHSKEHNINLRVGVAIYPIDGDTLPKLTACAVAQL